MLKKKNKGSLKQAIATALNSVLQADLIPENVREKLKLSDNAKALINGYVVSPIEANRRILEETLAPNIQFRQDNIQNPANSDTTISRCHFVR